MRLTRRETEVVVESRVAWEGAYLRAMQRMGILWVPVYRAGEALPCAEIHTSTSTVRVPAGQELPGSLAVFYHEDWYQESAQGTRPSAEEEA